MRLLLSGLSLAMVALAPCSCQADDGSSPATSLAAVAPAKVNPAGAPENWRWIHYGVVTLWAGGAADVASSWKQPEGNAWLSENGGPNAHLFYTTGLQHKLILTSAITAATYLAGWKIPKLRKPLGFLDFAIGGSWAAVAAGNTFNNPHLH